MANSDKTLVDVNTLSIFLVEDHPGHSFVAPELEKGLKGQFVPLLLDILPIRAYWIMTRKWGCDKNQSEKAIRHFLDSYHTVEYVPVEKRIVHHAFDLARELHHDVFDTVYLSAAIHNKANAIMTTDTGFQGLCQRKSLRYVNPVPRSVLEKFAGWKPKSHFGVARGSGPFTVEDEMKGHD